MPRSSNLSRFVIATLMVFIASGAYGQISGSWTYNADDDYWIASNIVYSTANNYPCKLDAYVRNNPKGPTPTVLYIHGGGWVTGTKESALPVLLPYLEMGLSVVNAEYRLASVSPAPAAVQDCRLALRWIFKNAKQYGFDTTRIVITGHSAGGHLALMTGMLNPSDGFDLPTDWDYVSVWPRAAAIINWYGITDVNDLLAGPNRQNYAVYWLSYLPDKEAVARSASPLTYVRKSTPPIFTVHGDKDDLVPYSHAVQLHAELTKANVPNQLYTVPGGKHGGFSREENVKIYSAIKEFLMKNKIIDR